MLTTLEEKVAPTRTALIVVDVQNDFCADDGAFAQLGRDVGALHSVVDRIERLVDAARAAGVLIIFLQYCQNDRTESDVHLEQRSRGRAGMRYCGEGTYGADFYRVSPKPGELVVKKHRYSGFVDTELDLVLRSSGTESLIMTGIATSGCVEATARDGFMKDYYIVLVDDCCGSYSSVLHEGTLQNVSEAYGIVTSSDAVMSEWEHAGGGAER